MLWLKWAMAMNWVSRLPCTTKEPCNLKDTICKLRESQTQRANFSFELQRQQEGSCNKVTLGRTNVTFLELLSGASRACVIILSLDSNLPPLWPTTPQ